ncbi:MAG: protein kinase [Gemmataceae bacterium]
METLFFAALERASAAERSAYLDTACGGDAEVRRQVERLLNAYPKVGDFLSKPIAEQLIPASELAAETRAGREGHTSKRISPEGAGGEEDDLAFLQPSTRPGALGRLGHYDVLQVLGLGGFGIVLQAFDDRLERVVAVKVLAPVLAASQARKRFLREARSSARVRHENVVHVYAVEEHPLPYLVMEYIPGETLQQRLDRTGPLDSAEVAHIGRQIALGLAAAHGTGLIHRDIKPANIMVEAGPHPRVVITDFGLARTAADASVTQDGMVAGTPMYMAPEQASGAAIDYRADLFSLGSVLATICSANRSRPQTPWRF